MCELNAMGVDSYVTQVSNGMAPLTSRGLWGGWGLILDNVRIPARVYWAAGLALHARVPILPPWGWIILFLAVNTFTNLDTAF